MSRLISWLKLRPWTILFWVATASMALALPIYVAANSIPSKGIVSRTIIADCPAEATEKCLEVADLLQAVGSFYEVVIIILVSLLAAVIALVYLSISASSKRQIEQQFEKDFDAPWFQHLLQSKVDSAMQRSISDMAMKIESLEEAVARTNARDDSEDSPDGVIVSDGGDDDGAR